MRLLVCLCLIPFAARAASVLLVPTDNSARPLAEAMVEVFVDAKMGVKMAGPDSPGILCLKNPPTRNECLLSLGEKAKVVGVIVVGGSILKTGKGTVTLELLARGTVLKKESSKLGKGKLKSQLEGPVVSLMKRLDEPETMAESSAVVTDAPQLTSPPTRVSPPVETPLVIVPRAVSPPPVNDDVLALKKTDERKPPKVKAAAWVMTGIAVAAAGAAAGFGVAGLVGKDRLQAAPNGASALSYSEAEALKESSNTQFSVALGAGIGAGMSGVVAGILWGVE